MDKALAYLAADIESLAGRALDCIPEGSPVRALVAGNLATCSYLLALGGLAESPAVEAVSPPARDLRVEMSGPLPPARQSPRPVPAAFNELPTPGADDYDVIRAEPDDICQVCKGPYISHPVDKKIPRDGDYVAKILCGDLTRAWVYAPASNNGY